MELGLNIDETSYHSRAVELEGSPLVEFRFDSIRKFNSDQDASICEFSEVFPSTDTFFVRMKAWFPEKQYSLHWLDVHFEASRLEYQDGIFSGSLRDILDESSYSMHPKQLPVNALSGSVELIIFYRAIKFFHRDIGKRLTVRVESIQLRMNNPVVLEQLLGRRGDKICAQVNNVWLGRANSIATSVDGSETRSYTWNSKNDSSDGKGDHHANSPFGGVPNAVQHSEEVLDYNRANQAMGLKGKSKSARVFKSAKNPAHHADQSKGPHRYIPDDDSYSNHLTRLPVHISFGYSPIVIKVFNHRYDPVRYIEMTIFIDKETRQALDNMHEEVTPSASRKDPKKKMRYSFSLFGSRERKASSDPRKLKPYRKSADLSYDSWTTGERLHILSRRLTDNIEVRLKVERGSRRGECSIVALEVHASDYKQSLEFN